MKIAVGVKSGKLVYTGADTIISNIITRINTEGGFAVIGPGPKKKDQLTDEWKIIKPTPQNIYMLEDYLPTGYEVE